MLQRMGVEVVDEHPYDLEIDTPNEPDSRIYDFGLRCDPAAIAEYGMDEAARTRFQEAFTAIWTGRAENDGFNALVPLAGLTWRQVVILRAYVKYLRQGGMTFSQELVEPVVANNRRVARLLVKLFEAKFSPAYSHETPELWESIVEEIEGALDNVQSLDEDRILRSLLKVIQATLRTNYFQAGAGRRAQAVRVLQAGPARGPGPAGAAAASSRSGSTPRRSRACTCASARWRAAACAGRTAARTSAPRSWAWSRRRW